VENVFCKGVTIGKFLVVFRGLWHFQDGSRGFWQVSTNQASVKLFSIAREKCFQRDKVSLSAFWIYY